VLNTSWARTSPVNRRSGGRITLAPVRQLTPALERQTTDGLRSPTTLTFLSGDEATAELLIRLALHTDEQSLLEIYEELRTHIAYAAKQSHGRLVHDSELDESLMRLVARLRPAPNSRPTWRACVIPTAGRGVAECVSHLLIESGTPSIVVATLSDDRSTRACVATVADLLPSVDFVIVDGSRSHPDAVRRCLRLLNHLDFAGSRTDVILLTDSDPALDQTYVTSIPQIVVVRSLAGVLAALDVTVCNPLTAREREVLNHVALGATNEQIARVLGVAVSTIKTYLERIQIKLKSRDRASAVATAVRRNWL
jgi:DNA-binding NarL/FixJ family response regulator